MFFEPGDSKDDRGASELGDAERDLFRVVTDVETEGSGFVRNRTGGDGATVDHLKRDWDRLSHKRNVLVGSER